MRSLQLNIDKYLLVSIGGASLALQAFPPFFSMTSPDYSLFLLEEPNNQKI